MSEWFSSVEGSGYASAMVWTLAALLLLLIVLGLVRIVRGLTSGTFVAGGRNRKTRLAVMDAAAVDSQRRLVLVRRDDVEHLILIGGNADVVIEQNIRLATRGYGEEQVRSADDPPARAPRSQPAAPAPVVASPRPETPSAEVAEQKSHSVEPPPVAAPAFVPPSAPPQPRAVPVSPPVAANREPVAPAPRPTVQPPMRGPAAAASFSTIPSAPAAKTTAPDPAADFDESLLEELQVTLEQNGGAERPKAPEVVTPRPPSPQQQRLDAEAPHVRREQQGAGAPTIEDEMSRLLGELSGNRR